MKKIGLLLLSLGLYTSILFSQGIILSSPTIATYGLLTPPNTDVTNDTIVYCVNDMVTTFEEGLVLCINNTADSMHIKVNRLANQYACYNSNQYCWYICYPAATSISPDFVGAASMDTLTNFHGWVTPNGTDGCCFIKYRFFNADSAAQYSEVTVKYCFSANCASPTLGDESIVDNNFSLYPNPAVGEINLQYGQLKEDAVFSVADLSGKMVLITPIYANANKKVIAISELPAGIYITSLQTGGVLVKTQKLVVTK